MPIVAKVILFIVLGFLMFVIIGGVIVLMDVTKDDLFSNLNRKKKSKKAISLGHKAIYDSRWGTSHAQIEHDKGFFVEVENVFCHDMPFIDFETFRKFYEINPDAWSLFGFSVCKDNDIDMCYTFTYEEWEKYGYWCEELKRKQKEEEEEQARIEKEQKDCASLQKLLDSVQKDIDAMNERAKAEINSAKEITERVMNTI